MGRTGSQFWKLDGIAVASGYPRPIQIHWPGLPDDIDAAFSDSWGRVFFFKVKWRQFKNVSRPNPVGLWFNPFFRFRLQGLKYWRFTNYRPDPGYPQLISDGFPGIPADLDAAFVWRDYGRIYFFKGTF